MQQRPVQQNRLHSQIPVYTPHCREYFFLVTRHNYSHPSRSSGYSHFSLSSGSWDSGESFLRRRRRSRFISDSFCLLRSYRERRDAIFAPAIIISALACQSVFSRQRARELRSELQSGWKPRLDILNRSTPRAVDGMVFAHGVVVWEKVKRILK